MGAATDATWEDMQDLHSRFPHAPAWGQADFQAWGLVRPPLKTQDCHNHRKPDDHELDGKTADQTADEQDDGTAEGIQEEGQGAGEAKQDAGGKEGIMPNKAIGDGAKHRPKTSEAQPTLLQQSVGQVAKLSCERGRAV